MPILKLNNTENHHLFQVTLRIRLKCEDLMQIYEGEYT